MTLSHADPQDRLSSVLQDLRKGWRGPISLNELIASLGVRSFAPLLIVFALPNLFFFVPGASVIIGPPLMFVAAQLVLGRPSVWLPMTLGKRSIDPQVFERLMARVLPWVEWVERLARPRYWVLSQKAAERTVGVGCLIMSVFVLLPIPFANALPALSVIMLAFSLGERDGLWLLGGGLIGFVSIALVFAIFAAGAFTVLSFS
ncbi:hypothetical protein DSM14862_03683 (plasmid) [Sulfitobacter indolifex]|uniref:Exopolysaccharide synthesis, ExoD n=1 Tax=Sulfitobacter indolifex HEL-45 TaxID=391624 RepID=A0ABP2D4V1_9RHOB|nr:exopolysaccharide biosynthesis protein [Sulfitobacter indolifex]EDQ03178.1 Exopolysaccharide synthesis, ExoD [Sulfitobacter indolifex HEL-45]UOA20586.1 hypothetical protein DSM14862_03424 [Sulfitobacter indolifex]UOA20845.1 hypothetical protein DSM14862_03683 [Sulfitobacter indolifex]